MSGSCQDFLLLKCVLLGADIWYSSQEAAAIPDPYWSAWFKSQLLHGVQLPANVLWKATSDVSSTWDSATHVESPD